MTRSTPPGQPASSALSPAARDVTVASRCGQSRTGCRVARQTDHMARRTNDRVTEHEGVTAVLCALTTLGAVAAALAPVGPRPAFAVIAGLIAAVFPGLSVHCTSAWRGKRRAG